jgi:hypothetical protein
MPGRSPVDLYVSSQPDGVRPVLQAARTFLHETVPGLAEGMKWRVPTFMQGRNLFYLKAQTDHVVLGFSAGARLKDHLAVFDAVSTEVAHVRVRSIADLQRPGLREAVRAAAGLPTGGGDFAERLRERVAGPAGGVGAFAGEPRLRA